MVKKIIIDEEVFGRENHSNRGKGNRPPHTGEGRFTRFEDDNSRKHVRRHGARIVETRLFTNRDKLVEYVNEKGQSDALIDIYKIEDELYKLVIKR